MAKKLTLNETKKLLKDKTILFNMWNCEYTDKYMYQNFYPPIKELFKEVILCDPKKRLIKYGPNEMKRILIDSVKINKPDFILFTVWGCGEFESIDLIEKLREVSPKSKILGFYADDDRDFEISSRFYAPFMDYNLVVQPDYTDKYISEGNKAFSFYVVDTKNYFPLNLKKKYDLTFIGSPSPPRIETMKFLMDNGVKVNIWGRGWLEYPEFKDIYRGSVNTEDFNKIISESKINLGFSKNQEGKPHFKARILENGSLKAFTLVDYFEGYANLFKEDEGIAMFKDNQELLDKTKYYLKNDKERSKIVENAYKKITSEMDIVERMCEIFREIFSDEKNPDKKKILMAKKTAYEFSENEISMNPQNLKNKMKGYDYVILKNGNINTHKYKEDFQIYSLEKTGKNVSCCSYYIYSKTLGNVLRFRPFHAFKNLDQASLNKLLNLNQFIVSKKFFLENFDKIKRSYETDVIDFVSKENTLFIDVPLFKTDKLNRTNIRGINGLGGRLLTKAFQPNFILKLYTKIYQKKLLSDSYPYRLLIVSLLNGNTAIPKYLYSSVFNSGNWDKLKKL